LLAHGEGGLGVRERESQHDEHQRRDATPRQHPEAEAPAEVVHVAWTSSQPACLQNRRFVRTVCVRGRMASKPGAAPRRLRSVRTTFQCGEPWCIFRGVMPESIAPERLSRKSTSIAQLFAKRVKDTPDREAYRYPVGDQSR